ncbi:MAG: 4Fe-4S binding protein [Immundisolibacteraceae bacterium]|nr:4Fe-4S binding protein [Immundisolibacteraceae bacterium]
MDRREFFKSALKRGARSAVNHAEQQVEQKAKQWIRPPFAIAELDFLLSCSRCGDCIAACPHQVVFALPARLGAKVVGTPALDLLNKGCHLCSDWPCVEACNETALALPETNPAETPPPESDPPKPALTPQLLPPKLATLTINVETCLPYQGPECGACDNSCPLPGALRWDGVRPVIDDEKCVGCGLCRQACILEPKAIGVGA